MSSWGEHFVRMALTTSDHSNSHCPKAKRQWEKELGGEEGWWWGLYYMSVWRVSHWVNWCAGKCMNVCATVCKWAWEGSKRRNRSMRVKGSIYVCIISVYAEHRECECSGIALHNCEGHRVAVWSSRDQESASRGETPSVWQPLRDQSLLLAYDQTDLYSCRHTVQTITHSPGRWDSGHAAGFYVCRMPSSQCFCLNALVATCIKTTLLVALGAWCGAFSCPTKRVQFCTVMAS